MTLRSKSIATAGTAVLASIAGALLVSASGVAGTGGGATSAQDATVKVRVQDNFFDPRSVGVAQGGRVAFVWKGSNRHNVRFTKVPPGASRRGSRTKTHGHWSRSLSKPGLYRYVCTLFSGMRGTITVKPPTTGEGQSSH
jgi:plastocyanin